MRAQKHPYLNTYTEIPSGFAKNLLSASSGSGHIRVALMNRFNALGAADTDRVA